MQKMLARLAAAVGLAALITTSAFAASTTATKAPGTTVQSHLRHLKSGKTVLVHGYTRTKPGPKKAHVKGYSRTTKSGKIINVKGYNRKTPGKKAAPMMKKP